MMTLPLRLSVWEMALADVDLRIDYSHDPSDGS
jgi:hypothetical protein